MRKMAQTNVKIGNRDDFRSKKCVQKCNTLDN